MTLVTRVTRIPPRILTERHSAVGARISQVSDQS